jgi:hypothetical protein
MIVPRRNLLYDPEFELVAEQGPPGKPGADGKQGPAGADGKPGVNAHGWRFRGEWHSTPLTLLASRKSQDSANCRV